MRIRQEDYPGNCYHRKYCVINDTIIIVCQENCKKMLIFQQQKYFYSSNGKYISKTFRLWCSRKKILFLSFRSLTSGFLHAKKFFREANTQKALEFNKSMHYNLEWEITISKQEILYYCSLFTSHSVKNSVIGIFSDKILF